jgi:hypothetical protein
VAAIPFLEIQKENGPEARAAGTALPLTPANIASFVRFSPQKMPIPGKPAAAPIRRRFTAS